MDEGTKEDYELLGRDEAADMASFPDRVLEWLKEMDASSPYPITRLGHSLPGLVHTHQDPMTSEPPVVSAVYGTNYRRFWG
jgi:hypothetical protein